MLSGIWLTVFIVLCFTKDTLSDSLSVDVQTEEVQKTSNDAVTLEEALQSIETKVLISDAVAAVTDSDSSVAGGEQLISENVTTSHNDNFSNGTVEHNTMTTENTTTKRNRPTKVTCLALNRTDETELVVQIMNSTSHANLFKTTVNLTVANCALLLFYAPWCHFSAMAAPHYNALPRLYPDIECIAINAAIHTNLNAKYGTIALPTLFLFHNGIPVAKFNESLYTLDKFTVFVKKYTGLDPIGSVNVTSLDFEGPLSSIPTQETDYLLWLAWLFIVSCCCYGFTKSSLCHRMIESLRNNWQEAEAQHHHID